MKYSTYQRNHVIFPGSEEALSRFLNATLDGKRHKWENGFSSNSEDALTWSCFDVLRNLPHDKMTKALDEIMEDAFGENSAGGWNGFSFAGESGIKIHIGKRYNTVSLPETESTETDASIETDNKLIFIEAKLYSSIEDKKPYSQIIKKMRVGLDVAHSRPDRDFYFIFLDVAPMDKLLSLSKLCPSASGFGSKWKSADHFERYKTDPSLLHRHLADIPHPTEEEIAGNMGWLTWASLFKTVLRGVVS
jgi:hypothetical protein